MARVQLRTNTRSADNMGRSNGRYREPPRAYSAPIPWRDNANDNAQPNPEATGQYRSTTTPATHARAPRSAYSHPHDTWGQDTHSIPPETGTQQSASFDTEGEATPGARAFMSRCAQHQRDWDHRTSHPTGLRDTENTPKDTLQTRYTTHTRETQEGMHCANHVMDYITIDIEHWIKIPSPRDETPNLLFEACLPPRPGPTKSTTRGEYDGPPRLPR